MRIITFGTFDLFHIGHLNILEKCKNYQGLNNIVIVGVSSDKLNYEKKNLYPIINESDRETIIKSIRYVDIVFKEESLEQKLDYCKTFKANVLIMGDDHKGKFDYLKDFLDIDIIYLPRTKDISTTNIRNKIINL